MPVRAYILIQTDVGKSTSVAGQVRTVEGVLAADDVIGPYDVIAECGAESIDELGRLVLSKIQMIDGITRTLTCSVVNL